MTKKKQNKEWKFWDKPAYVITIVTWSLICPIAAITLMSMGYGYQLETLLAIFFYALPTIGFIASVILMIKRKRTVYLIGIIPLLLFATWIL